MYTSHPSHPGNDADPFVLYSRSLHDYTLKLWTESIRVSQERSRERSAAKGAKRRGTPQSEVASQAHTTNNLGKGSLRHT